MFIVSGVAICPSTLEDALAVSYKDELMYDTIRDSLS